MSLRRELRTSGTSFLRPRNEELERQVRILERDNFRLNEDMEISTRRKRELEVEVRGLRDRIDSSATSSLEADEADTSSFGPSSKRRKKKKEKVNDNIRTEEITKQILDVVNQNLDERMRALHTCEDKIFGLLKEITKIEEGIRNLQGVPSAFSRAEPMREETPVVMRTNEDTSSEVREKKKE